MARILVVDDEVLMREGAAVVLERDHEVLALGSPAEALDQVGSFKPDLAILDVRMPYMDGFELMGRLKEIDPELDVILMTGSVVETDQKLIRALREQAFYFLLKPFDRAVLLTLVDRCLELRRLEETNRRHTRRLESELAEARAFQQSMVPPPRAEIGGRRIHAAFRPAEELCGDLYDYAPLENGLACLVADVSSHGASAAMLTGMVKSAFHSSDENGYDPLVVANRVGAALRSFPTDHFVTLFACRLRGETLDYVGAGHPAGLLWGPGMPLAAVRSDCPLLHRVIGPGHLRRGAVRCPPGSHLLLYTDGVTEARGESDRFETARLEEVVALHPEGGGELVAAIVRAVEEFAGGRPLVDDLTLLTLRA